MERRRHPGANVPRASPGPISDRKRQLEDLTAEAEEEARTVEDLRRKNRELQISLQKAQSGAPQADAGALERARNQGRAELMRELGVEREQIHRLVSAVNARVPRVVRHLEVALVELGKAQDAVREPFDV